MKKLISVFILLFANNILANVPDIVALVNDQPITKYDFQSRKNMITVLNNVDVSNPNINHSLNSATINMLIGEEILMQYASEMGMKIREEQIIDAVGTIEKQNNMPSGGMAQMLKSRGLTTESFKKQITGELIKYNIASSLSNSVSVSPSEIDVAIINSLMPEFNVTAWIFTAKDQGDDTYKHMQHLRKTVTNCEMVNTKLYENFADGEKFNGNLQSLHVNTKSIIHDTDIDTCSSIYQEDGKSKMVLICQKDTNVSPENLGKIKAFLSNKKMSQKATRLFKNLRNKANIKIMLPS